MHSSRVPPLAWLVLLLLLVGGLAGCEDAIEVGAVNDCGRTVEARADDVGPGGSTVSWKTLTPGARRQLVAASTTATRLYFEVRTDNDETTLTRFDVATANLPRAPADSGYKVEIQLTGDRCPHT